MDDMRESPSLTLIDLFEGEGAEVSYNDPYIPVIPPTREHGHLQGRQSVELKDLQRFDVAVIATKHSCVEHSIFAKDCGIVVDTRNALDKNLLNVFKA